MPLESDTRLSRCVATVTILGSHGRLTRRAAQPGKQKPREGCCTITTLALGPSGLADPFITMLVVHTISLVETVAWIASGPVTGCPG